MSFFDIPPMTEPGQPMTAERLAALQAGALLGATASSVLLQELCNEIVRQRAEVDRRDAILRRLADPGGVFERSVSDEDCLTEAAENGFLDLPEDLVIVCDDCYQAMTAWKSPEVYVAEQKALAKAHEFVLRLGADDE